MFLKARDSFPHIMLVLCWIYPELGILSVVPSPALEQMAGRAIPELGILEDGYFPALGSEMEHLPQNWECQEQPAAAQCNQHSH